jgi:hypothetical protein
MVVRGAFLGTIGHPYKDIFMSLNVGRQGESGISPTDGRI